MKRIFLLLTLSVIVFASCKKDDKCPYTESTKTASSAERTVIRDTLIGRGIASAYTEHSSGFFYAISDSGSSVYPTICNGINIKYVGKFMTTGVVFDYTTAPEGRYFRLGDLIVGWQKSLPLLKRGGKIHLFLPPSLAYGSNEIRDQNTGVVVIPANSYMEFDIELLNVQ